MRIIGTIITIATLFSGGYLVQKDYTFKKHEHAEEVNKTQQQHHHGGVIMISEEDGKCYVVMPHQTLGDAMTQAHRGSRWTVATQEGDGKCYRGDVDIPPEEREKNQWNEACRCHEVTHCNPGGDTDAPTGEFKCKRHCNKSDCDCCAI